MLDHTIAAIKMILDDLKRWGGRFRIFFSLFTLTYLIYCLIMKVGIFVLNQVLLALYVIYTVFQIVTYKRNNKRVKKKVTRIYSWIRIVLKTLPLASTLYGIYIASSATDGITLILATLTIITWVLQLLFEILIIVIESKARLITAGFMEDTRKLTTALDKLNLIDDDRDYDEYKKEREIIVQRASVEHAKKIQRRKEKGRFISRVIKRIKRKKS